MSAQGPHRLDRDHEQLARGPRAFFTSWRSWTGRRGLCCRGACRTRWMPPSPGGARGGLGALWQTRDLQHRPGQLFTSTFTGALERVGLRISMDGLALPTCPQPQQQQLEQEAFVA